MVHIYGLENAQVIKRINSYFQTPSSCSSLLSHLYSPNITSFSILRSNSKESACNAGDAGSIPGSGRSPGKGNDNPLHYYCLKNPMDREVWWATVHGVTVRQDWECTCILRSKGESKMQKQSQSLENMLNKSVLRNHLLGGWQTFLVKGQIANISVFVGYNVSHIFCFPTTPPQPLQKLKL